MTLRAPSAFVTLAAAIVALGLTSGCSTNSAEPTSSSSASPTTGETARARAELTVDGHTHTLSGPVECSSQPADPNATPPRGELKIKAGDDAADVLFSLSSGTKPTLTALSFSLTTADGEYRMPYSPSPRNLEVTAEGNDYTVKGTPAVAVPNEIIMRNVPVEIHVTCP